MTQLVRLLVVLMAAARISFAAASGADFLRVEIPARAAGMGGAFVAMGEDPTAFQWNPASLAGLRQPIVSATHFSSVGDTNFELATYVQPLRTLLPGALGLLVQYSTTANFFQTDALGNDKGQIDNYDLLTQASYGLPLTDRLGAGISAKIFSSRLQDYRSRGLAVDFGIQSRVSDRLNLGLSFLNLGSQSAFDQVSDPLPTALKIGLEGLALESSESSLLMSVEVDRPWTSEDPVRARVGAEYWYVKTLAVRIGYRFNEDIGNLCLGAGLKVWGLSFDYAFVPFNELGQTHRLSLSAELGTLAKSLGVPAPAPARKQPFALKSQAPAPSGGGLIPWGRGTRVAGTLLDHTVWTRESSPYIIASDLTIPKDITLTVEAGVEVRFAASPETGPVFQPVGFEGQTPQTDLIIRGRLAASGTSEAPVSFVGENGAPWGGIIFEAGCDNTSRMEYCRIEGGRVIFNAASPSLVHSHLASSGVEVGFLAAPEVAYNRIEGGEVGVLSLSGSSALSRVHHNLIAGNRYGLYLKGFAETGLRLNTFTDNTEFDVINYTSKKADVSGNYWAGRTLEEVRKAIYDEQSNPASGPVIITPTAR